ncbi:hypothetical protein C1646_775758 [Rhizophagus diaphanus]|nr:hypothetical protein C1646_775758 [Rhizophagus diaphanus] [Rhizophagus sp. MUCL 43196]
MPRKTKRQLQINEIPRKKGRYISKDQEGTEIEAVEERTKSKINGNWTENETVNVWEKEDLEEFEKVGKRLITEGMRTLDTLFRRNETSTSLPLSQSLQLQFPTPSPSFSEIQNLPLHTEEATRNLEIRLKEISQ